ncbi:MAG: hypothetical protein H6R26_160 [Proteobacteria bacterium]|nr:hypothetical protein [Pseudomonadota bacterium]
MDILCLECSTLAALSVTPAPEDSCSIWNTFSLFSAGRMGQAFNNQSFPRIRDSSLTVGPDRRDLPDGPGRLRTDARQTREHAGRSVEDGEEYGYAVTQRNVRRQAYYTCHADGFHGTVTTMPGGSSRGGLAAADQLSAIVADTVAVGVMDRVPRLLPRLSPLPATSWIVQWSDSFRLNHPSSELPARPMPTGEGQG